MIRRYIILVLLFIIFIPFNVGAVSVRDTAVMGVNEKKVGETVSVLFKMEFSDISKTKPDSLGIWIVGYELIFDDTVFSVVDISSSDWVSDVYKENGKYYVLSEVGPDAKNLCMNGAVFCGDYFVTIDFFIKDTAKTSSIIKMGDIEVGLLDMQDENKEYTLEDLITITATSNKSHTINIKHDNEQDKVEIKEPASILEDKKPLFNNKEMITNKGTTSSSNDKEQEDNNKQSNKSSNNYLKSLKINNYDITFHKNKNDYVIEVNQIIDSLDLEVTLEDSNATYKIIGANDLAKNNNKVIVEVTAENGNKKNYTIQVKINEDIGVTKDKKKNIFDFKIEDKYIVGGAIFVLILVIIWLIIHIRNRKIEKAFDRL